MGSPDTLEAGISNVAWQDIVRQIVVGLGYDLVELERSAGGFCGSRSTYLGCRAAVGVVQDEQFVTVEDCEKVTRQLQFALEVEGTAYSRLEVSSPGIDRPFGMRRILCVSPSGG